MGKPGLDSPPPTKAIDNLVGETFAHYQLDELISQGRTGLVFKGTDTESGRRVAVKVLLPNVSSSEEQRDRFVRAMKTMLLLKHRAIVSRRQDRKALLDRHGIRRRREYHTSVSLSRCDSRS